MDFSDFLTQYWWILVILFSLILYKFILRFLFGMVIVPENRIGLVTKKFVLFGANRELPDGRIIATKGEAGALVVVTVLSIALALVLNMPQQFILEAGSVPALIWQLISGWIVLMVGISVLTTLYGHYIEKRELV